MEIDFTSLFKYIYMGRQFISAFISRPFITSVERYCYDDLEHILLPFYDSSKGGDCIHHRIDGIANAITTNQYTPVISPFFYKTHKYPLLYNRAREVANEVAECLGSEIGLSYMMSSGEGITDLIDDNIWNLTKSDLYDLIHREHFYDEEEEEGEENLSNTALFRCFHNLNTALRTYLSNMCSLHQRWNCEQVNKTLSLCYTPEVVKRGLIVHIQLADEYQDKLTKARMILGDTFLDLVLSFCDYCYGEYNAEIHGDHPYDVVSHFRDDIKGVNDKIDKLFRHLNRLRGGDTFKTMDD